MRLKSTKYEIKSDTSNIFKGPKCEIFKIPRKWTFIEGTNIPGAVVGNCGWKPKNRENRFMGIFKWAGV